MCVCFAKLKKGCSGDKAIVKHLRLDFFENLLPQGVHLFHEIRPHPLICHRLKLLQVTLILSRPNHCKAVSVLEERYDHPPYSVFVLNCI